MSSPLIERAEQHEYQKLFLHDLNWSRPVITSEDLPRGHFDSPSLQWHHRIGERVVWA